MSKRQQQIISSIAIGSTVASLAVTNVEAASAPKVGDKPAIKRALVAQTPAAQQPLVPNPNVTIDGVKATPGVGLATPTMPRAVAPPVGDISVSNIDAAIPQIKLDSGARTNLTLKNAPAREVLESLARAANLNLAYSDSGSGSGADGKAKPEPTVSVNFRNEPVQNAFNYVLQLGGLEANRVGNTIFVGTKLPDSIRETVVRTLRMNQVTSAAAANFLTTQGAETQVSITKVDVTTVGTGAAERTVETRTPQILSLKANEGNGTLLLKGLSVSTDERLNSVTLVGSPRKVEMATAVLTRLDARRRQVAINIKIVDVNLNNNSSISNSLSFGSGDSFFSADKGAAVYNYGGYNPPSSKTTLGSITTPPVGAVTLPGTSAPFLDYSPGANQNAQTSGDQNGLGNIPRPNFGSNQYPYQPGIANVGKDGTITYAMPGNFQYPTKFLSTLQAQIVSGNGKILTDPTLVVQEGQKSTVNLTQEVFAGFKLSSVASTGGITSVREPIIKQAGLILDVLVNRIDDNGYVSVGVNPTVSTPGAPVPTADGSIALLQSRTLTSGEIRLRDGQTLILSGIIQETDRTDITKVPILGDIPLLGALFRSTNKTNQRQEVVVLLTPQILSDNRPQVNYAPGNDARQMMNR